MPKIEDKVEIKSATKRHILQRYVSERSEPEFMKDVVTPLFENMGFETIFNHGALEEGKDYILKKNNEFGEIEYTTVVVKLGDISGSSKGKNTLNEVKRQVSQCLENEIELPGVRGKLPNKVIVLTPGSISATAKREISHNRGVLGGPNISFVAEDQLIKLLDEHYPIFFQINLPTVATYLGDLIKFIEKLTTIDVSSESILNLVNLNCTREIPSDSKTGSKKIASRPEDVIQSGGFVCIQGGTGSGKTFTVYKLAEKSLSQLRADAASKKDSDPKKIFIPLYMKSNALERLDEFPSIEEFLFVQLRKYSSAISLGDLKKWIKSFSIVVVCDEYESLCSKERIDRLVNALSKFEMSSTLVLSRLVSQKQLDFSEKPEIWRMKDINLKAAKKVISQALPSENQRALAVYNEMLKNGVLERIPRTPLALNVLSQVFSGNLGGTPINMFEFFDMFFELVLGRWEPQRETDDALDYLQIRHFLQEVAFEMVNTNQVSIPVMQLLPIAEKVLKSVQKNETIEPMTFIEAVARFGEIAIINENEFQFTQRTFMEFLAGCEFEKHHWNTEFFIEHITKIHWEDALVFAAGSKKKHDELLAKVDHIKEDSSTTMFFKMKNIALVTQALYQSSPESRVFAIKEGVKTAVKLRDNKDFIQRLSKIFPENKDLMISLVNLSLFSTFYGKTSLNALLMEVLGEETGSREKIYLFSAIVEAVEKIHDVKILKDSLPSDVTSVEGEAIGVYLKGESKHSANSDVLRKILKDPEIKKVTEKSIKVLQAKRKDKSKYFPTRK